MKGFGIYVKNDLLEPKHVEQMGPAIWLYLWFLDKMTSVSEDGVGKILGGKPITHDEVERELGLTLRTYRRWISLLRTAGYIETITAPRGLIIMVNKAKKVWGAKNGTPAKSGTPGGQKRHTSPAKNGTRNKTEQLDKTVDSPNGELAPTYGNPEINALIAEFEKAWGFKLTKVKLNRFAARRLLTKYGAEKVLKAMQFARACWGQPYKPQVHNLIDLEQKMPNLAAEFSKQQQGDIAKRKKVVSA